jgi:tetratricopeptide (TPR) repeat protein
VNPSLEDLVAEFVARCESGESLDPRAFAAEHPDVPQLLAALQRVAATEALFPTSGADDPLPAMFGPYRVLGEIGRGGSGRVLEVEHPDRPGEMLALKLLAAGAALNPRAIERLRREGSVLQRLRHPGIVRVHDVGIVDGTPFLAIDRLRGESLAAVIARARVRGTEPGGLRCARLELPGDGEPPARVAHIVERIAQAVAAAHAQGLLHRDVKPGNVILTEDGEPVLIDFGLAADDTGPTLTRTGDVLGTPHYMAPEQARGERADERSDVHGIGAVLYELLTLQPPRPGDEPVAVLDAVRRGPVPRVRRIEPRAPPALDAIARRAMAFDPRDRYASAASLADDLQAFLAGGDVAARGPARGERMREAWRCHGRAIIATAGGAALAALAALALLRGSDDHAPLDAATRRAAAAWLAGDDAALVAAGRELAALAPGRALGELLVRHGERAELPEVDDPALRALAAGLARHRQRDWPAATAAFKEAAAAMPGSPLAAATLGVAALFANEFETAEVQLATVARLLPESAAAQRYLGRAYREHRRLGEALAALERACALGPDDPANWQELARARLDANEAAAGLAAIERALTLARRPSATQLKIKGVLLDVLERFEAAREIYRGLIERDPDDAWSWQRFAWSFDRLHQFEKAEAEYLSLIERLPGNAMAPVSLAWLYAGSNRAECDECRAFFAAHPEYFRPEAAEKHAVDALAIDRGRRADVIGSAVKVAVNAGRSAGIRAALEALLEEAHTQRDDDRILRLTKALRELPK